MVLITPEYQKLNAELHVTDQDWGRINPFVGQMAENVAQRYGCQSVLDYGCGKGDIATYHRLIRLQLYDPAVPWFTERPEPSDLVVCSAVLEHVEPDCMEAVLDDLEQLTQRVALLTVATVPSSKFLPDGRNAHASVYPIEWWLPGLSQRWTVKAIENMGPWFWFLGKKRV